MLFPPVDFRLSLFLLYVFKKIETRRFHLQSAWRDKRDLLHSPPLQKKKQMRCRRISAPPVLANVWPSREASRGTQAGLTRQTVTCLCDNGLARVTAPTPPAC